jgi:uncharacterized coiled-coil DUF342 family protein
MFLGYQNDKIAFIAETKEELENLPCVILDKIEETDKTYFLHKDGYVFEVPYEEKYEEVRQTREQLYKEQKDPITCQIQSLRDEEETEEILAEIEALKVKRAEIVAKIKEENPYPEENI